jgi:hypothetical protein
MTKQETIERFCKLSRVVLDEVFDFQSCADCFCTDKDERWFQFQENVMKFIEDAVDEKVGKEAKI